MILRLPRQEFSGNSVNVYILIPMCLTIRKKEARGEGYSLKWPIQGRAAGQGMGFGLSVLNRVYLFLRVCGKQGLNLS